MTTETTTRNIIETTDGRFMVQDGDLWLMTDSMKQRKSLATREAAEAAAAAPNARWGWLPGAARRVAQAAPRPVRTCYRCGAAGIRVYWNGRSYCSCACAFEEV